MKDAIIYNLKSLLRFSGRDSRARFWPYALTMVALWIVGFWFAMLPMMRDSMIKMQRFAREHPDQATVTAGPGHYSIQIEGHHPDLMPDFSSFASLTAIGTLIFAALVAAAATRRLHDIGRSGAWGMLPAPFLGFAIWAMPRLQASMRQPEPDMTLFFGLFVNNVAYLAAVVALIVLLARSGLPNENRFGPPPQA